MEEPEIIMTENNKLAWFMCGAFITIVIIVLTVGTYCYYKEDAPLYLNYDMSHEFIEASKITHELKFSEMERNIEEMKKRIKQLETKTK